MRAISWPRKVPRFFTADAEETAANFANDMKRKNCSHNGKSRGKNVTPDTTPDTTNDPKDSSSTLSLPDKTPAITHGPKDSSTTVSSQQGNHSV